MTLTIQPARLILWCAASLCSLYGSTLPADDTQLTLSPGETESTFEFATDDMEGTIRLDGNYHGVSRLVDKRTGRQVIDSRYSALNLFKLMSVNLVMGQPRIMERSIASEDNWAEVTWPETDSHLGELTARYEVSGRNSVDVIVRLRSNGNYAAYELFMSNYFDGTLRPHVYLKPRIGDEPQLVLPTVNDVFRDTVLVFPRDPLAARHCVDGRWERSEGGVPFVQMCPVRRYGYCLAFLTDPEEQSAVVLMARPEDCYAISTRYHGDTEEDRLTDYSAFDLSLFGDDVRPGDQRSIRVRLALTPLDDEMSQPLEMYRAFVNEMREDE
ncbi:MAG: hypothetical protein DWQ34_00655 [Planctomycetota bacterium]|nr:MAG: hypothetical protein DWQ34_00655 [Planctomycetota bacterium]REK25647.1 MAG: hypothetical protein DWQ41_11995 [Planctomycetota bacterium]REK31641.1 MAG: hypothetical protein DWQ45_18690 [Planctomycetota bacterium]